MNKMALTLAYLGGGCARSGGQAAEIDAHGRRQHTIAGARVGVGGERNEALGEKREKGGE